jgi:hypothetical protein
MLLEKYKLFILLSLKNKSGYRHYKSIYLHVYIYIYTRGDHNSAIILKAIYNPKSAYLQE